METAKGVRPARVPWNKGKLTGQKPPLKLLEIWAIRVRLQLSRQPRNLATFNLAIDSNSTLDIGIAPSPAPMRGSDQAIPTTKRDES
jgi:hypothetical protein